MSKPIRVEPDILRAAAPKVADAADALAAAFAALSSSLSAEGECWGADEPGSSFAEGYVANADSRSQEIQGAVVKLRSVADKLIADANSFQDTDTTFGENLGG